MTVESVLDTAALNRSHLRQRMTPIVKLVGDYCNLKCEYCFYHGKEQATRAVMADDLLEAFISEYLELFIGELVFIWHGGEPLLAGLPVFDRILDLQARHRKKGQRISNHVQTNGTLITDRWAEFFKVNDFRVGISLDGRRESHDRFRKDRHGRGTFDRVRRGMDTLKRHGLGFGVVQVITASKVDQIVEDFEFFARDLGLKHWSTNAFKSGDNATMAGESLEDQQMLRVWRSMAEFWMGEGDPQLALRDVESFIHGALGRRTGYCAFNGDCSQYFCVDMNGAVYPCDSFSSDPKWALGNLRQESLQAVLEGERRRDFLAVIGRVEKECSDCQWHPVCHGGCPWLRVDHMDGPHPYCHARQEMFGHMRELIAPVTEPSLTNKTNLSQGGQP